MKKWFKILTGKTESTPAEITGEIENLRTEQAGVKARLTETQEALETARMELYGGSGKQTTVDGLEGDVKALQIQVDVLGRAIADMDEKHKEAVEREKQAQVKALDKKIADLRQWMADIRPEYIRAKLTLEAYEMLLTAPDLGVGMASTQDLLVTGKERAAYQADVDAITQGHGSIMSAIMQLQKEKEQLIKA
jgi:predicted  nucleic acid-binding Zn-ribbon protein